MSTTTSINLAPIRITSHYTPTNFENEINIVSQITHLVDSYFIWVGGTVEKLNLMQASTLEAMGSSLADDETNIQESISGFRSIGALVAQAMQGGFIAKDFSCAMPSNQVSMMYLVESQIR